MSKNFIKIFTENNFIFIVDENKIIFSLTRQRSVTPTLPRRCNGHSKDSIKNIMYFSSFVFCWVLTMTPLFLELARRLDTLHVVVSGQPNATSKPNGLHTGFSGLPRIAVKGGSSYV